MGERRNEARLEANRASGRLPGAGSLPTPLTPLLGRDAEVASVVAQLRDPAMCLLVLTGPGGVGKSRVAIAAAAQAVAMFPDGVDLIRLAPLVDATLVIPTIAAHVGVREVAGQPQVDVVAAALREQRRLLVLDSFEAVMAASSLVAELLRACPGLKALVTSRIRLHVRGERVVRVLPLPLPPGGDGDIETLLASPAVELFVERARDIRADFALSPASAPAVAEIVRRLDGLPLAIELAAARLDLLPPAALLARLDHRLPLLTGGPGDLPERLRTMRGAIAWSFDFLDDGERRLMARLSVFAGGFGLDAAAAICGGASELDILDAVGSLVDKSLLQQGDGREPRYGMLDTIREFSGERLAASAEEDEVRKRHAAFFLELAARTEPDLVRGESGALLRRLDLEHDNLRSALAWAERRGDGALLLRLAGELWLFWALRGHLSEGSARLERALAAAPAAPSPERAQGLFGLGTLRWLLGDSGEATRLATGSLAMAEAIGSPLGTARATFLLGRTVDPAAEPERAAALFAEARRRYAAIDDGSGVTTASRESARLALATGHLADAARLAAEALALYRADGYDWGIGNGLHLQAQIAAASGAVKEAPELLRASLRHFLAIDDRWQIAMPIAQLARWRAERGEGELAARVLGALAAMSQSAGPALWRRIQPDTDRAEAAARRFLDPAAFTAAWEAGRRTPLAQIVTELSETTPGDSGAGSRAGTVPRRPPGSPTSTPDDSLTAREADVLRLLAQGRTNPEIGDALFIGTGTVRTHVSNILAKLGARSRTEAALIARERGLI